MIVCILSIIDLLAGSLLLFNLHFFLNYITAIVALKGLFSIFSSLGAGYWFDWMGFVDILTAIALLLFSFGVPATFFTTIAWIIIFKGIYCLIRSVFKF